jgi:hypothetical protein
MRAIARFKDLCLDANDHQRLARWWCDVLGYEVRRDDDEPRNAEWPVPMYDPSGRGPDLWINPVPEVKQSKNRMHMDVWGNVNELLERGATLVRPRDGDIEWDVLADPEGNEFCVFRPG